MVLPPSNHGFWLGGSGGFFSWRQAGPTNRNGKISLIESAPSWGNCAVTVTLDLCIPSNSKPHHKVARLRLWTWQETDTNVFKKGGLVGSEWMFWAGRSFRKTRSLVLYSYMWTVSRLTLPTVAIGRVIHKEAHQSVSPICREIDWNRKVQSWPKLGSPRPISMFAFAPLRFWCQSAPISQPPPGFCSALQENR